MRLGDFSWTVLIVLAGPRVRPMNAPGIGSWLRRGQMQADTGIAVAARLFTVSAILQLQHFDRHAVASVRYSGRRSFRWLTH